MIGRVAIAIKRTVLPVSEQVTPVSYLLQQFCQKMPREYMCKKCGRAHLPPTGKKCTRDNEMAEAASNGEVITMLTQLKEQFDTMQVQMDSMRGREKRHADGNTTTSG